jgi:outer membrane protein assembly factor BamB
MLTAMVLTAVVLRWRARGRASHGVATIQAASDGGRPLEPTAGLGAGPPPDPAAASSTTPAKAPAMLHGDPRHTHRSAGLAPSTLPIVAWARDVGGPVEAQVTASPDGQTLYVASLGGALTALARDDGSVRWTVALGDRVYATPCVAADGTVYVGSDAKKFLALTPTGQTKWSFDTDGDADTGAVIAGDGLVVFAAGRMVYGVDAAGQARWRFAARRKVFTGPAIGTQGRIYFGSQDHHVYALAADGRPAWSLDLGVDIDGAPAIDDRGAVFVGTDGDEVVRVDADDGHVVWRAPLGGYVRGTLSIARNGDVLAGVYGPRPRQVRLRADDGAVRGELAVQGTGAREFGVHGGAMEDAAGTLVFGAQDDALYAVDASSHLLWRFLTGGDVDAPATLLDDGTLIVGSDDGTVRALRGAR